MSTTYESLRVEKNEGIAEVTITGPGKGNAMGPASWREIPEVFTALDADPEIRVVVVTGEGPHFTYGLDLMAMMGELAPVLVGGEKLAAERTELLELIVRLQETFNRVASCRKPVIAAVSGWCIGAGMDFISACDIRVCSANAKFSVREVKIAIVADVGALQRLPRIIGDGLTRELAMTGRNIDAQRALRIGLVSEIYPTAEEVVQEARNLAREIASNPPLTVQGIKQVMNDCDGKTVAEGLRHVALWNSAFLQSADFVEAVTAFAERREPKFQGR